MDTSLAVATDRPVELRAAVRFPLCVPITICTESGDLPDTDPVDRLRIGKDNSYRSVVCALVGLITAVGRTGIGKFRLGRWHRFRDQKIASNSFND